jgi:hypothetical protein
MSAATLPTLAEHIDEHDLSWAHIHDHHSKLAVQLSDGAFEDLARWAVTFEADAMWRVGDFRGEADGCWHVHAIGSVDGDLEVWCAVPADFAPNAEALEQRLRMAATAADLAAR